MGGFRPSLTFLILTKMKFHRETLFLYYISFSSKSALGPYLFEIDDNEKRERRARPSSHPCVGLFKPIEIFLWCCHRLGKYIWLDFSVKRNVNFHQNHKIVPPNMKDLVRSKGLFWDWWKFVSGFSSIWTKTKDKERAVASPKTKKWQKTRFHQNVCDKGRPKLKLCAREIRWASR